MKTQVNYIVDVEIDADVGYREDQEATILKLWPCV